MPSFPVLTERIAVLIARLRLRTRAALAERLGYSRTQLHAFETGKQEPSPRFLSKLSELERAAGIGEETEQKEDFSGRLEEPAEAYEAPRVNSDAEIAGLAALLNQHSALVTAGERRGALPDVEHALQTALQKRGVLPKKKTS